MDRENTFSYTYSAQENREVLRIREKYLPREENKLEELKRLDRSVRQSGVAEGLLAGIMGCLVFGLGMCLAMEVIGHSTVLGVICGILGMAAMGVAYPIYRRISARVKARLTPRILQLASELTGEGKKKTNNNFMK